MTAKIDTRYLGPQTRSHVFRKTQVRLSAETLAAIRELAEIESIDDFRHACVRCAKRGRRVSPVATALVEEDSP